MLWQNCLHFLYLFVLSIVFKLVVLKKSCQKLSSGSYFYHFRKYKNLKVKVLDKIQIEKLNGITLNNLERLEASIKYAMKIAEQNGHTYVNKNNLVDFVISLTGAEEEYVLHAIDELSMKRYLNIEEERISLESLSIAELEIATKLEVLKNAKIKKIKNVLDKIIEIESEENIALTTEQRTAIISALENNVTIITGGPRNR